MNPETRTAIRDEMVIRLRRDVELEGGSLSDGLVVLLTTTMEAHAAIALVSGVDEDSAKTNMLDFIRQCYDMAFCAAREAFLRARQ